jgi:hypothetical protein
MHLLGHDLGVGFEENPAASMNDRFARRSSERRADDDVDLSGGHEQLDELGGFDVFGGEMFGGKAQLDQCFHTFKAQ